MVGGGNGKCVSSTDERNTNQNQTNHTIKNGVIYDMGNKSNKPSTPIQTGGVVNNNMMGGGELSAAFAQLVIYVGKYARQKGGNQRRTMEQNKTKTSKRIHKQTKCQVDSMRWTPQRKESAYVVCVMCK